MKVIRKSVFETNSSSVHSLSVYGNDIMETPTRPLQGYFEEFGWGYESYKYPEGRLSYVLVEIARGLNTKEELLNEEKFLWVNEVVKEYTGSDIFFDWEHTSGSSYYPFGYIDHQSIDYSTGVPDVLLNFWSDEEVEFKKNIRDFIFNNKYTIEIDNDNH